ncbi:MAG: DUF427 domain-containing protein [Acidimicrobiia bacterium]|jgi:uncharacterized protein (DUF427 family)
MSRGRVRIEDGLKRVRVYLDGEVVADTTEVKLVWEKPYYPVYYFPEDDVRLERLTPSGRAERSPSRGTVEHFDVEGSRRVAAEAAYRHPDSPLEELRGLVAFRWDAMDAWFEEDEEVFVHARDPYTRVDVLASSRHVRVEVGGVPVADSRNGRFLFETGLPVRRYLPKTDVRMDLLRPTETVTRCPYKGTAEYWSVVVGDQVFEDLAWSYPAPFAESAGVAGLISFYDEKVDVYVDGVLQPRPQTIFSAGKATGESAA